MNKKMPDLSPKWFFEQIELVNAELFSILDDIAAQATADEAREYAIMWQHATSERDMSYGELAIWQSLFTRLASRFPELKDEFQENGIY